MALEPGSVSHVVWLNHYRILPLSWIPLNFNNSESQMQGRTEVGKAEQSPVLAMESAKTMGWELVLAWVQIPGSSFVSCVCLSGLLSACEPQFSYL